MFNRAKYCNKDNATPVPPVGRPTLGRKIVTLLSPQCIVGGWVSQRRTAERMDAKSDTNLIELLVY